MIDNKFIRRQKARSKNEERQRSQEVYLSMSSEDNCYTSIFLCLDLILEKL